MSEHTVRVTMARPPAARPGDGMRQTRGDTWWKTALDDPRGWRPAWWRLTEQGPALCTFELYAYDGESGSTVKFLGPWNEALPIAREMVAANDAAYVVDGAS